MKTLKQILTKNSNLHSMNDIVQENFKFKINRDTDIYIHHPKTWDELRQIIEERFEELGPGTAEEPIDFNDIDVNEVNSFYDDKKQLGIFEETDFEYIDISNWDVSNVTNMHAAFWGCKHLKSIGDLSNWNVSSVEDMWHMFGNSSITNIPDWYEE